MDKIGKVRMWGARAVLGAIFLASVDGISTEGKYGGAALDWAGKYEAANKYRLAGKFGRGAWLWVSGSVSSYDEDITRIANKYGQPKP